MTVSHESLIRTLEAEGKLKNPLYAAAFKAIKRETFLPGIPVEQIYSDEAVTTKLDTEGIAISSSSQPSMMLQMLEQMQLDRGHNVLEIGAGTGYNAAIMQHIVGDSGSVTTIEIDNDIARQAKRNLQAANMSRVNVVVEDGASGYAPRASYDRILCTASIWDIPAAWVKQLKPNGIIVAPIQLDGFQVSARFTLRKDGILESLNNLPCRFVYVRGIASGPSLTERVGSTDLRIISANLDRMDLVALHSLISYDYEICHFDTVLDESIFWWKFVPYAVLNEPKGTTITMFFINADQKAYGMEGVGITLFAPGSAVFVPYGGGTMAYCFAGSDAFLAMQSVIDDWKACGRPGVRQLTLNLIPKYEPEPDIKTGMVYDRHDHYLHAWLDTSRL